MGDIVKFSQAQAPVSDATQTEIDTKAPKAIYSSTLTESTTITELNRSYLVNVSATGQVLTLGGSPDDGDELIFKDISGTVNDNPVDIGGVYTLDDNSGAVTIKYLNGSWTPVGDDDRKFAYNASGDIVARPSGAGIVASKMAAGNSEIITISADEEADFTELEASVEYSAGAMRNKTIYTDLTPSVDTATSSAGNYTTYVPADAIDGSLATFFITPLSVVATNFILDFGPGDAQVVDAIRFGGADSFTDRSPKDFVIAGSNDGSTYTDLLTVTTGEEITLGQYGVYHTFTNTTSYRYYRIAITDNNGGNVTSFSEVQLLVRSLASSNNSFKTALDFTNPANQAPATLVAKNASNADLDDGEATVAWSDDNVTFSSQMSLSSFRALAKSNFSGLDTVYLQWVLVGANNLAFVSLSTEGAEFKGDATGAGFDVDGVRKIVLSGEKLEAVVPIVTPEVDLSVAGATIPWDASQGNSYVAVLTEDQTLQNPTNLQIGATYIVAIKQGATPYNLTFDTNFYFVGSGGVNPTISQVANSCSILACYYDGVSLRCNLLND